MDELELARRRLLIIQKRAELKANRTKSLIKFNSNYKKIDLDYDYSSADNYLESKRQQGWFGGRRH